MSIKVNETLFDQPDVSKVTPAYVPPNGTRSYTLNVTFINGRGQYQETKGYWDDLEKIWRYASSGEPIEYEIVKSDPIKETKTHY